ncbi:hypothetical protein [uncultured Alistipes sp.]|jgi:hypothetical protein|uniref:hypothetical protein n=1 Tax=uncultured Alistipes sp. TaxID=538949 RepID=UPI0026110A04|nr:hypothetical protein [uncultured Alistipes sp.]
MEKRKQNAKISRLLIIFVVGLGKLVPDILNKKRYAHQVFGNVGNFQIAYSDGIVVLTHIAWAAITTSVCKVSYDLQIKTWHCSSTLRG